MSCTFLIAILNCTCFFLATKSLLRPKIRLSKTKDINNNRYILDDEILSRQCLPLTLANLNSKNGRVIMERNGYAKDNSRN